MLRVETCRGSRVACFRSDESARDAEIEGSRVVCFRKIFRPGGHFIEARASLSSFKNPFLKENDARLNRFFPKINLI